MRLGSKRSASKRTGSRGNGRKCSEQTQGTGGQETEGQGTGTDQKSLGTIPLLELFHIVHNKKFLNRAVKML